jgi:hypothetical protein
VNKQVVFSFGLVALIVLGFSFSPNGIFHRSANAQQSQQLRQDNQQEARAPDSIEYGRLVFAEDQKFNWIVGDEQIQRPLDARGLITRLGGTARRASFATLLDTLGNDGWELIFETEDPEGYGDVLIFKRSAR